MEELREKFLKIYANVPEGLRQDIIVIVDGKTYNWNTSYFEIKEKTKLGERILKELESMEIL